MTQTESPNHVSSLGQQIYNLGLDQNEQIDGYHLPAKDLNTFATKLSKKRSNSSFQSNSYFDQNQFRLYAISSKKAHRNLPQTTAQKLQSLKKGPSSKRSNKLTEPKKRSQSGILLGFNKNQPQDIIKNLYQQYLTMEEIETRRARQKLERKIEKFMPKNSSFSQFYGEKVRMMEKQAKRQEGEVLFGLGCEDKSKSQRDREMVLNEILKNKTINFKNRLRNRSHNKDVNKEGIQSRQQTERQKRQKASSQLDMVNSPTYSESSELKARFQYFPQPKTGRSSRLIGSFNTIASSALKHSTIHQLQPQHTPSRSYLNTIRVLQQASQKETKRSQYLINTSKKKQEEFEKSYQNLNGQTLQAIYGFSQLKLDEQTSDSFKDQLREMWMKNDITKGNPKNNRLNKRKKDLFP